MFLQLICFISIHIHTKPMPLHTQWVTRQQASHLAARSASLKSLECHRLALQKWDDRGVCCDTHYPVNPPVSALPNSLELKALSPAPWQLWPHSWVMTNWVESWTNMKKCTQINSTDFSWLRLTKWCGLMVELHPYTARTGTVVQLLISSSTEVN